MTKRLARSLGRTKLRLYSVILMIAVGVVEGISFGTYANSTQTLYDNIYADDEDGVHLPDIWVENSAATWDGATAASLCQTISEQCPDASMPLETCEPRRVIDGLMLPVNEGNGKLIPAVWHGIDEGRVDRVWMPENDCCSGRLASADDEIVLDEHAASGLESGLGDTVSIGAGYGRMNFTVGGIGYPQSLRPN